jgi:hypothetical protein
MTEDEEIDDREFPDESETDDSDEPELIACPHCRKMISEIAEQCPHCRGYVSREDVPRRMPWWIVAGAIAALGGALFWIL